MCGRPSSPPKTADSTSIAASTGAASSAPHCRNVQVRRRSRRLQHDHHAGGAEQLRRASKYPNRSLRQKLIELRVARLMERSLTKDQILQLYVNAIYMGNGVYGVEAASRDLFGKSVGKVTLPEAAMLAALPKAPSVLHAAPQSRARPGAPQSRARADGRGGISSRAIRLPGLRSTRLRIAKNEWRPDTRGDSYALDAVRAFTDSVLIGRDDDDRDLTRLHDARYQVRRKQRIAPSRVVRRRFRRESNGYWNGARHSVQGAMVALDPRNGDIRALTGGRRYERGNYNRALKAKRQPGSAFKPFVYVTALSAGYSPASDVRDEPVEVVQGRTVWTPANYDDEYLGLITFRRALMRSSNAAAVRVSQLVGLRPIIENAHRMGIQSEIPNYPAVALGAIDVTPIELVRAYAPFANGGFRVTPRLVRRIESRDGDVLWSGETAPLERVIDPRDAYRDDVDAARCRRLRNRPAHSRLGREGNDRRKNRDDEQRHRRMVCRIHAESRRCRSGLGTMIRTRSATMRQADGSPRPRGRSSIRRVGRRVGTKGAWEPPPGLMKP